MPKRPSHQCANIGPADYNYDETISTLRYANRAKNIKNKARINEDPKDALLRQFQKEIEDLKKKLEEGKELHRRPFKVHVQPISGHRRLEMLLCAIAGEEISGSEASGSEEMDEGEDEGAEAGDSHRRRRGKPCGAIA